MIWINVFGRQGCTIACRSENTIPNDYFRLKVKIDSPHSEFPYLNSNYVRHYCELCEHSTCVNVCPTHASFMDENGIVDINMDVCVGCFYCVIACPYNARYINPVINVPDKCNFCKYTHLKEYGKPVCVAVCSTDTLIFGDLRFAKSDS